MTRQSLSAPGAASRSTALETAALLRPAFYQAAGVARRVDPQLAAYYSSSDPRGSMRPLIA